MNEMIASINRLKKEQNAIILAHSYQPEEIQDIADIVGDSFQLAKEGAAVSEDVIVFAGVLFMAETALILAPHKKVFLTRTDAGCPMADMITAEQLVQFQKKHPGSVTVCYVNSSAEVKAHSDVCCTSSSAIKIINHYSSDTKILFVPDENLGTYAAEQTKRQVTCWPGFCNVHVKFKKHHIDDCRKKYPHGTVMVHPECTKDVRDSADHVLSTGGMLSLAMENRGKTFIVGTETGLISLLKKKAPDNEYIPAFDGAVCRNMKKSSLQDILDILEGKRQPITLPQDIMDKARGSLEKMLELGK